MKRSFALPLLLAALLSSSAVAALRVPFATAAEAEGAKRAELVDLNSAGKPELVKLPGVGEAIADKIMAGRPWKSKYDLVVKKVVTRSTYDKFARLVIARQ
ncbi:MAG: helix-hairpin-helix domain-containing protein [Candidatus Eisenbacteria bacterium]